MEKQDFAQAVQRLAEATKTRSGLKLLSVVSYLLTLDQEKIESIDLAWKIVEEDGEYLPTLSIKFKAGYVDRW